MVQSITPLIFIFSMRKGLEEMRSGLTSFRSCIQYDLLTLIWAGLVDVADAPVGSHFHYVQPHLTTLNSQRKGSPSRRQSSV